MKDVAFIFPGQGAQAVGMGKEFYESSAESQAVFQQADEIVKGLSKVMFEGPAETLTSTAYCQPAIFTYSIAALCALQVHPVYKTLQPKFACGLSLGEYSALCSTGGLSFRDTMKLVVARSSYMEEATQARAGTMAAIIGFDKDQLVAICQETGAEVANFNAPDQIVITGEVDKVKAASAKIEEAGAKRVIPLDVSGAFHSSLMKPAAERFRKKLRNVRLMKPEFPMLSNVDAKPTQSTAHIIKNLSKQITSSVQWIDSIEAIAQSGVTTFLEVGPGTVLKGLIRKINPELKVYNIRKPEDLEKLT